MIVKAAECLDCRYAADGVVGEKSGDSLDKGIATHRERYPDHELDVFTYDDEDDS